MTFRVQEIPLEATYSIRTKVLYPNGHYGVVDHHGTLIAVGTLYPESNGRQARVRKLAVLPEYQGQGVGKLLLQKIIEEASKRGIERCWLSSRLSAQPFYIKCGLKPVGEPFLDAESRTERRLYEVLLS